MTEQVGPRVAEGDINGDGRLTGAQQPRISLRTMHGFLSGKASHQDHSLRKSCEGTPPQRYRAKMQKSSVVERNSFVVDGLS